MEKVLAVCTPINLVGEVAEGVHFLFGWVEERRLGVWKRRKEETGDKKGKLDDSESGPFSRRAHHGETFSDVTALCLLRAGRIMLCQCSSSKYRLQVLDSLDSYITPHDLALRVIGEQYIW